MNQLVSWHADVDSRTRNMLFKFLVGNVKIAFGLLDFRIPI